MLLVGIYCTFIYALFFLMRVALEYLLLLYYARLLIMSSYFLEGALSIEVWGHRSAGFSRSKPGWEVEQQQLAKARSLADRWSELTRKIELWVEIQELNEQGEYSPVEVAMKQDTCTGENYCI